MHWSGEARKGKGGRGLSFFCLLLVVSLTTQAAGAESARDRLNDCNWIVNYRGRTYDLAPLTREALARPIESDIRYALQRVPQANEHLNKMSGRLKDARGHTILASIFVSTFGVLNIVRSGQKNDNHKRDYNITLVASGAFFLGAAFSSWRATRDAKDELVKAVDAFNEHSSHKIVPATASDSRGSGSTETFSRP